MLASRKSQLSLVAILGLVIALVFASGCAETEKKTEKKHKPKVAKPTEPLTAKFKVDKTKARPGEGLDYTILIKNNTEKPLEGVKIKFLHPGGVGSGMRQKGGSKPTFDEQTKIWTWDVGTIQNKESYWFSFTIDIAPDAPSGATISAKFDVESSSLAKPVSSNIVVTTIP